MCDKNDYPANIAMWTQTTSVCKAKTIIEGLRTAPKMELVSLSLSIVFTMKTNLEWHCFAGISSLYNEYTQTLIRLAGNELGIYDHYSAIFN